MITCLLRIHQFGPWEHKEYLDSWRQQGINKVCSFCGSMHPDEFLDLCKKVIETKAEQGYRIELSDKRYKIYIHQEGVSNCDDGALKFYTQHIPEDRRDEYLSVIYLAASMSWEEFLKTVNKRKS